MGNRLNKHRSDKEIISEKSLVAIRQLLNFLKQNVRNRELFNGVANDRITLQIVEDLQKGGAGLENVVKQGLVAEGVAALQYYLVMRLKEPLIPYYIQALALDNSPGVSTEVIAQDILGLLRQDLTGRHEILLCSVLDLLNAIIKCTPTNELSGYYVPSGMLPIFFNKHSRHSYQWRKAALVFLELIRLAPLYFDISSESLYTNNEIQ